jgi:hypothetical protein
MLGIGTRPPRFVCVRFQRVFTVSGKLIGENFDLVGRRDSQ